MCNTSDESPLFSASANLFSDGFCSMDGLPNLIEDRSVSDSKAFAAGQISFPSCSHPIDPGTGVTDFVSPLPFGNALPMSIGNEDVSSKPSGSCSLPPEKKGKKVKFLCKITPRQRLYGRCGDLTAARLRRLFQREWPPRIYLKSHY